MASLGKIQIEFTGEGLGILRELADRLTQIEERLAAVETRTVTIHPWPAQPPESGEVRWHGDGDAYGKGY